MKAKVIKNFVDRFNHVTYKTGDVVDFNKKRIENLISFGFVTKIKHENNDDRGTGV